MVSLKEKYENYLMQKDKYEKEKFLYDNKESELRGKVIESLKNVDTESLALLGFSFTVNEDELSNSDYLISKVQELKHIREQLEERGKQILINY